MSPEEKSLLERTYKLCEENNTILLSLRRANRIGTAVKIFYWVVIIGLSVGAFYFIQPYINFMSNALGVGDNGGENVDALQSQNLINNLQELLK